MNTTANASEMNFKTKDLITKLKTNRSKHVTEYNEAVVGYKEKITETLKSTMKKFKDADNMYEKGFVLQLTAPVSYEKEYTVIIEMLTFCTDESIRLDRENFKNYVMDEWHWKNQFNLTASMYNNKLAK